jgi:hypothetical protein
MRHSLLFVGSLCGLFVAASVAASEVAAYEFRAFRFESRDLSGPVVVKGTQGDHGITALHITAFGKSFTLTPAQLKQLRGLMVNGVQLSGEGGYIGVRGRTLYLFLSMGFGSDIRKSRYVTISEEKGVKVEKRL